MKKILLTTVLLSIFCFQSNAQGNIKTFTDSANSFFKSYVNKGAVDYAKIKANDKRLKNLVNQIAIMNTKSFAPAQEKAFYINAYNLLVIDGMLIGDKLVSPLKIDGFFDKKTHVVGTKKVTLNQLEKEMLFKKYFDPRLHFALVCGAKGCPPLQSFAFRPEKIEAQLEQVTKNAFNNSYFLRIDKSKKEYLVSEIFNWYKADFEKDGKNVLDFINKYLKEPIPSDYKMGNYTYDWAPNTK